MQQEISEQKNIKKGRRLPKYKRDKINIRGIIIQKRDIEILKLIHDYRFINSEQIRVLGEGSGNVILRRLQKLYHHGYIDRPKQQIRYGIYGSDYMIYALGNKGADVLAEQLGIDRGKIDWGKKNIEVKERHIFHTQMITQVRATVSLAAKN